MNNMVFAAGGSAAWDAAWAGLALILKRDGLGDGADIAQEHDGERWQYMGTVVETAHMVHDFRHRDHPVTQARLYRKVITDALAITAVAMPELPFIVLFKHAVHGEIRQAVRGVSVQDATTRARDRVALTLGVDPDGLLYRGFIAVDKAALSRAE